MTSPAKILNFNNEDFQNINKIKKKLPDLLSLEGKKSKGVISLGVKAVSVGTLLSLELNCPHGLIRKKTKGYGTNKLLEGWKPSEGDDIIFITSLDDETNKDIKKKLRNLCINQTIKVSD